MGIMLDFLCELYYDARIHEHQVIKQLIHTDSCNSDIGDMNSGVNLDTTDVILGIRFVVLQVSETFCTTNEKFIKHKTTDFHMIYFIFHELYNPLWVLAFSTKSFQTFLFSASSFQFFPHSSPSYHYTHHSGILFLAFLSVSSPLVTQHTQNKNKLLISSVYT
jgi:hypothetical protein